MKCPDCGRLRHPGDCRLTSGSAQEIAALRATNKDLTATIRYAIGELATPRHRRDIAHDLADALTRAKGPTS